MDCDHCLCIQYNVLLCMSALSRTRANDQLITARPHKPHCFTTRGVCRPVSREARHDRGDGVRLDLRDVAGAVQRPALRPLPAESEENEALPRRRGDRLSEDTRLRGGRRVHGFRHVLLQIGHDLPRFVKRSSLPD
ncbi:unnamed protein product [Trichogramma brassicae]|uniref:Uncharacterized protein n=1 Tax=Trichogramma brassicae TaxID=86971 RepID=A0A6H5IW86_9HYME|nr:unnamed protein product [Trichogramma brassicae]